MTGDVFDSKKIEDLGWRQGSVLTGETEKEARSCAPEHIVFTDSDWLIVSSHDCDIANFSLKKEPVVEVVRFRETKSRAPDKQQAWGRNPRTIHLEGHSTGDQTVVLSGSVHDRWSVPRQALQCNGPCLNRNIDDQARRVIAEWLAKRYIRAAFPSQFDIRWRGERSKNLKKWTELLAGFNQWIQGIYLRLSTMRELTDPKVPYRCLIVVAIPTSRKTERDWPQRRDEIQREIEGFWRAFEPGVICDEVEVLGTDEITLDQLEYYQRFDADWLSFSDDESPATPLQTDLRT